MSPQGSPGKSNDNVEGDSKEEERNKMADAPSTPVPTEGKTAEEEIKVEKSAEDTPQQGPEVKDDKPGRSSSCTVRETLSGRPSITSLPSSASLELI